MLVRAGRHNAERESGADKEVIVSRFRFEYTKEVLNEMANIYENKKIGN